MKNSNLEWLKWYLGFFLYMGIFYYIVTLASPALYPVLGSYLFTATNSNAEFTMWQNITPNTLNINYIWDKILLFFSILNYSILLYALYQFRRLIILFQDNIIFEKKTQKQLKLIGKLIIINASIFFFIDILLTLIHRKLHVKMNPIYVALLCVGHFFNVLAEVFERGKKLKEENELTI